MFSHLRISASCLILLVAQIGCMENHVAQTKKGPVLPKVPDKPALSKTENKLDQSLYALAKAQRETGEKSIDKVAEGQNLSLENGKVRVDITLDKKESLAALKSKLPALGVDVITDLENHLYALVPVGSIEKLAALDEVWSMAASRPIAQPIAKPADVK